MFYERKIIYLDMLVDGKRQGSAGFWKLEARDSICNMTIQVTGARGVGGVCCPVYLVGNGIEKALGKIEISGGRGSVLIMGATLSDLCGSGIPYEELEAISIPIAEGREIRGVLRETLNTRASESMSEAVSEVVNDVSDETVSETVTETKDEPLNDEGMGDFAADVAVDAASGMPDKIEREEQIVRQADREESNESDETVTDKRNDGCQMNAAEDERKNEEKIEKENEVVAESRREEITENTGREDMKDVSLQKDVAQNKNMRLQDTKWKQLCAIYPCITPFQDEREYLSISPSDFVLLPSKYFRLVNNSFLLHGYYNYKHLVLKEIKNRNETRYYIGVPGTFFDREKQVAVMFGFESFECMEEPAKSGDFGYYLMRIEL